MNQEKIGKFIAQKRKENGLKQSDISMKLGVTDRSVSNWERGKNMPDLSLFYLVRDKKQMNNLLLILEGL